MRTTKLQKQLPTTMQCISHSRRVATHQRMFVCDGLQHGRIRRREKNRKELRSGISEAETTNNKRRRSTFYIEAIQTADTKHRAASM